MIGTMIRQLVDQGLTSLRELETVTDRGTSTIYRWMNGESEPHCSDLQKLVKRLSSAEARRTVLGFLTSDLPVHLCWFDADDVILYGEEPTEGGQDVLSKSLEALDDLSEVLKRQHDAIRRQDLSPEGYTELVKLMDDVIYAVTTSRNALARYAPMVKQAARQSTQRRA